MKDEILIEIDIFFKLSINIFSKFTLFIHGFDCPMKCIHLKMSIKSTNKTITLHVHVFPTISL